MSFDLKNEPLKEKDQVQKIVELEARMRGVKSSNLPIKPIEQIQQ